MQLTLNDWVRARESVRRINYLLSVIEHATYADKAMKETAEGRKNIFFSSMTDNINMYLHDKQGGNTDAIPSGLVFKMLLRDLYDQHRLLLSKIGINPQFLKWDLRFPHYKWFRSVTLVRAPKRHQIDYHAWRMDLKDKLKNLDDALMNGNFEPRTETHGGAMAEDPSPEMRELEMVYSR